MRFVIKHEIRGRIRVQLTQKTMSYREADILQYFLENQPFVVSAKVQERTRSAVIYYTGDRQQLIQLLEGFNMQWRRFRNI